VAERQQSSGTQHINFLLTVAVSEFREIKDHISQVIEMLLRPGTPDQERNNEIGVAKT
jgi:hypothetical protein